MRPLPFLIALWSTLALSSPIHKRDDGGDSGGSNDIFSPDNNDHFDANIQADSNIPEYQGPTAESFVAQSLAESPGSDIPSLGAAPINEVAQQNPAIPAQPVVQDVVVDVPASNPVPPVPELSPVAAAPGTPAPDTPVAAAPVTPAPNTPAAAAPGTPVPVADTPNVAAGTNAGTASLNKVADQVDALDPKIDNPAASGSGVIVASNDNNIKNLGVDLTPGGSTPGGTPSTPNPTSGDKLPDSNSDKTPSTNNREVTASSGETSGTSDSRGSGAGGVHVAGFVTPPDGVRTLDEKTFNSLDLDAIPAFKDLASQVKPGDSKQLDELDENKFNGKDLSQITASLPPDLQAQIDKKLPADYTGPVVSSSSSTSGSGTSRSGSGSQRVYTNGRQGTNLGTLAGTKLIGVLGQYLSQKLTPDPYADYRTSGTIAANRYATYGYSGTGGTSGTSANRYAAYGYSGSGGTSDSGSSGANRLAYGEYGQYAPYTTRRIVYRTTGGTSRPTPSPHYKYPDDFPEQYRRPTPTGNAGPSSSPTPKAATPTPLRTPAPAVPVPVDPDSADPVPAASVPTPVPAAPVPVVPTPDDRTDEAVAPVSPTKFCYVDCLRTTKMAVTTRCQEQQCVTNVRFCPMPFILRFFRELIVLIRVLTHMPPISLTRTPVLSSKILVRLAEEISEVVVVNTPLTFVSYQVIRLSHSRRKAM